MNAGPPPEIWLVTGMPGAGKTSVARALAARLERSAHIEGDRLAEWVVGGRVLPGEEPAEDADRQIELSIRNQCLLARSFAEAGFTPVIDYVIAGEYRLAAYRAYLSGARILLAVLAPPLEVALERDRTRPEKQVAERWTRLDAQLREQLAGTGAWIDNSALDADRTAAWLLEQREEALLRD